eukprot:GHVU01128474.1.p2 GENE.GHVU01128474.1~~GHVU01128474.1.p2  ORF type:complete len:133 (-),score=11.83 GHVU01128474.1:221-619(-)
MMNQGPIHQGTGNKGGREGKLRLRLTAAPEGALPTRPPPPTPPSTHSPARRRMCSTRKHMQAAAIGRAPAHTPANIGVHTVTRIPTHTNNRGEQSARTHTHTHTHTQTRVAAPTHIQMRTASVRTNERTPRA